VRILYKCHCFGVFLSDLPYRYCNVHYDVPIQVFQYEFLFVHIHIYDVSVYMFFGKDDEKNIYYEHNRIV